MSRAYYNEFDKFAAAWLRELIKAGAIAPGDVDERSILDVRPGDLDGYTQCHFFAGIGVWSYALRQAGWSDDEEVWTGSCPCQPFSKVGRGGGFADERHLWPAWFHLVEVRKPPVVYGEQVASSDGLEWLDLVQSDLEGAGYAFGATDMCAAGFGAKHIRQRLYFVSMSDAGSVRLERRGVSQECTGPRGSIEARRALAGAHHASIEAGGWDTHEPCPVPVAHGIAGSVGRIRGYGNAIHTHTASGFIQATLGAVA